MRPSFETPRKSAAPQDDGVTCGDTLILLLAERRAEGVAGIDPDNPEFAREEF
jgi:hypothetical protein